MADSSLFSAVKEAFASQHWACRKVPNLEVAEADFDMHHGRVRIHAQAFSLLNAVVIVGTSSLVASTPRLPKLAELMMAMNRTLTVGAFEVDWTSGAIMFRCTNLFPAQTADVGIIASLLRDALVEIDRLAPFPAILEQTPVERLKFVNVPLLLEREDLLPTAEAEEMNIDKFPG